MLVTNSLVHHHTNCAQPLHCHLVSPARLTGYLLHFAAGRLAADIIASKPQHSQAKELCSFALLNLTWNSIVKLLQLLADVPDQLCITQGKHTDFAH